MSSATSELYIALCVLLSNILSVMLLHQYTYIERTDSLFAAHVAYEQNVLFEWVLIVHSYSFSLGAHHDNSDDCRSYNGWIMAAIDSHPDSNYFYCSCCSQRDFWSTLTWVGLYWWSSSSASSVIANELRVPSETGFIDWMALLWLDAPLTLTPPSVSVRSTSPIATSFNLGFWAIWN